MGQLKFFEAMIEKQMLDLHTAFLAKILSVSGNAAKIQPLLLTKETGGNAKAYAPISSVPITNQARYKLSVNGVILSACPISSGDIISYSEHLTCFLRLDFYLQVSILKTRKGDLKKMKVENKCNLYLKVRVSQEEMDAIKHKFRNSGMDMLSRFVSAMIFEGYIVQMDGYKLQEIYLS